MQTKVKNEHEIEAMRKGGKVLADTIQALEAFIKPGVTGTMIDKFAGDFIEKHGMIAGFKGMYGFPGNLCLCINEEVVHGIPSKDQIVKNGDIVTVDCGVLYQGLYTDSAATFMIGDVDPNTKRFVETSQKALYEGIKQVKVGNRIGDASNAIETVIKKGGYKVIKELVGHGIGEELHEDPNFPNFGKRGQGMAFKPGLTFAIEPIVGMSTSNIVTREDNWMIETVDGSLACQFEHTVLITSSGCEILTLRDNESFDY